MAPALELMAREVLGKRDNSGFLVAPAVIVLLAMCGAGVLIVVCYGAARFWMSEEEKGIPEPPAEQVDYMRELRARNLDALMADGAHARYQAGRATTQSFVSDSTAPIK
ncbi:hypothetical protein P280DRAFT_468523 [Massarina eburnea CBS 473.64]|uniref:Uncharacterized protein n=1 Tax=Massarina eburnea CBS 473.64 TaxID=1395130 RepID=A0A6A6S4N4_9PLEO|nr:hypothetical protein P280DRAFT_468523 [Massarina eburnea CBS 473.64]